jgi:hypothetical protein
VPSTDAAHSRPLLGREGRQERMLYGSVLGQLCEWTPVGLADLWLVFACCRRCRFYEGFGSTNVVTTQRCLPILRFRVNPSFS